ncbi:conserved virulence factor C family protein [Domibacillus enclensis]|uniref:HEAT repeat-containing protein n=1 Tax=Domibacillus enclensis TaxID=1017273 RepID=A0A1N6P2R8_9BACI|nr:conserved virulence factor C family protein [Domibacillus enclensis]OXS80221.1 virulence factor [Domibacillus enclensis]SIP98547.1 HEAT repeat-containing protein [Domibacillus enclensis]
MNILKIEPTPSPNTMKVILDEELAAGKSTNYKPDNAEGAPDVIQALLKIDGVKGVYHVADFIALERNGRYDWQDILPNVRAAFGETDAEEKKAKPLEHFGEVETFIQVYKGIPLQLKLASAEAEKRVALPDYCQEAFAELTAAGDNYILERKWQEFGIRYGELDDLAPELLEEVLAAYPKERIDRIVEAAKAGGPLVQHKEHGVKPEKSAWLAQTDWRTRYQQLEQMPDPDVSDIPLLEAALQDEKAAIRRLAVVYAGMIEDERILPVLFKAMEDSAVTVRRTAGDCMSDLGFPEAAGMMIKALQDRSKIVRWRAAMFLYEMGDEQSLPALREAADDPEFEVKMQVMMAIERIEGGEEAKGSVWKQMTEARNQ